MEKLIIVRGGGDIASGTIRRLHACGFAVLVLEAAQPSAIRRNVAFSEAVYQGCQTVEGLCCSLAADADAAQELLRREGIAMLVDPEGLSIDRFHPSVLVDAILAKRNLGTHMNMAPVTIALGPGFEAGRDVHAVVETKRGHNLGRVIYHGCAAENTGVPGLIGGYGAQRVIHSPAAGVLRNVKRITDTVAAGETIAVIESNGNEIPVRAGIDGLLRGLIRDGYRVSEGFKIADIDPRMSEYENCFTISDKARCIAGGVVEAILHLGGQAWL